MNKRILIGHLLIAPVFIVALGAMLAPLAYLPVALSLLLMTAYSLVITASIGFYFLITA